MVLPNHIPSFSPSVDAFILLGVAASTTAGILLGNARVKLYVMSIYVGMAVAMQAVPLLHTMVGKPGGLLSATNLKVVAFFLCIGVLGFFGANTYHKAAKSHFVLTLVAAFSAGLLLTVAILSFLEPGVLNATKGSSTLASMIYDSRLIWLLAPPLTLMVNTLFGPRHR